MSQAVRIVPLPRAPDHVWRVPGSKSITNRALVLAALAEGETVLTGALRSDDTDRMRECLAACGIAVDDLDPTTWRVRGGRSRLRRPAGPLFVGNSGTTVRFLTALACLIPGPVTLTGDRHMAKRPIADLVEGLRDLGMAVDCPTGCPPLTVQGGRLPGGAVMMDATRSSQFVTALLLAASAAESPLTVRLAGDLVSRPYVEMTCAMITAFGGVVETGEEHFTVRPAGLRALPGYAIEPDASAASYAFAAAAATGGRIRVPGLIRGCLQGDLAFVDVLARTGCAVACDAAGTTVVGRAGLNGVDEDLHHISDTVMTLAGLAPLLDGPTAIRNVANIRLKETDRLAATATELTRLGQDVQVGDDGLLIAPQPVRPARIECYADHRMAMGFSILGLAAPGVTIADRACVAKTYPGYWDDLAALYRSVGAAVPW